MALIVQKFGGSSVANPERIRNVALRVAETAREGHQVVVVVSAMGDTTDELLGLARQLSPNPSSRELDMLLTTGEQISIALLAMALQTQGVPSISFTGGLAGIHTEPVHGKARILSVDPARVRGELAAGRVVVVAGFQGVAADGSITTLGRGGSDTTAVALATALQADLCEIYTDVEGVYTTDPRVVKTARKIDRISYDEMLELAHLGAGVLHPRAVECAKLGKVRLMVRSSFLSAPGTVVEEAPPAEGHEPVRGVAHDDSVVKLALTGVHSQVGNLKRLFSTFAAQGLNVDIIFTSIVKDGISDISFTVAESDRDEAVRLLQAIAPEFGGAGVAVEDDLAKVSVVGKGMTDHPGVAACMFEALAEAGIPVRMVTTSDIKISCGISRAHAHAAVHALHRAFGLDGASEAVVAGVDERQEKVT